MKKRIFIALITAALTCACLSAFAACKSTEPTNPSAPPASDSTGDGQADDQDNVTSTLCPDGHNFVNGACTVCNESEYTVGLAFVSNGDGTCYVDGIGTAVGPEIRIPPVSPEGWQVVGIGGEAFSHQTGIKSVTIPDGVTSIGKYAFYRCSDLTSIHIPNSVISIDEYALASTALTSVVLPTNITTLSEYVLAWCENLTNIDIPNGVTSIEAYALLFCESLTNIHIPNSVTSIGHDAFHACTSLTSMDIPNGVTSIEAHAFLFCESLTNIHIPNSVTSIESPVFGFGNNLTSITVDPNNPVFYATNNCLIDRTTKKLVLGCNTSVIPTDGSVTTIGTGAFWDCREMTAIHIPDTVTVIKKYAFARCTALTSIHLPNSVTELYPLAFTWCESLTSVTLSNNLTSIPGNLFYDCTALTSIHIPSSITEISEDWMERCSNLASITVDPNNPIYHSEGNCLIETASKTLVLGCKTSVIPSDGSVMRIGTYAFRYNNQLTNLAIPNGVTEIATEAFANCSALESISIANSVTEIGSQAFEFCTNLKSICLPNNLTKINAATFGYCRELTNVTIPKSVTSIGENAFFDCNRLIDISYQGTTSEWMSITKGRNWVYMVSVWLAVCQDGAIKLSASGEPEATLVLCESGSHWRVWAPSKNAEFGMFYDLLDEEGRVVHCVRLGNEHCEVKFIWRSEEILYIVNGSVNGTTYHRIYNVKTKQLSNLYEAMIAQHGNTFAYLSYDDHKNIEEVCIRNKFDENGLSINYKLSLDNEPAAAWFEDDLSALYIITKTNDFITLHIQDGKVTSHTVGKKEVALNSYEDVLEAYKLFAYLQPDSYLFNLYNCEWIQTPDEATKETLKIMYNTLSIRPSAWKDSEAGLQYYQKDINGDGCEELIIGRSDNSIWLLFTMYEGKPVLLSANLFSNSSLKISKDGSIFCYLGYPLNDFSQSCYVLLPGDNKLTHVETFSQYRNSVTLMNYYHRLGADEEATLLSEEEYLLAMENSPYFGISFESIATDATKLPLLNQNDSRPLPYIPYAKG